MRVLAPISFAVSLLASSATAGSPGGPCAGAAEGIECLVTSFRSSYREEYQEFWAILHDASEGIIACESQSRVTHFLSLAQYKGNAEFAEFFNFVLLQLAINDADCFIKAWIDQPVEIRASLLRDLHSPIKEVPSRDAVSEALEAHRGSVEFEEFFHEFDFDPRSNQLP